MARTFTITTPENVTIEYQIAGAGSRTGAALVDLLVQGIIWALLIYLALRALAVSIESSCTMLIVAGFLIMTGYEMLFEWLWNGQTPGKRLCGLRVVREQGLPVDASAVVIRNLFRVVDFLPGLYGVGIISMIVTENSKRLGDLAAGTIVVKERKVAQQPDDGAKSPGLSFETEGPLDIPPLAPQELEALRRFVGRKAELPENVREDVAQRIAKPLFERIGYTDHTGSYAAALESIYMTYMARKGGR